MQKKKIFLVTAVAILVALIVTYAVVVNKFGTSSNGDSESLFGESLFLWDENKYDVERIDYVTETASYSISMGEEVTLEGYDSLVISRYALTQAIGNASIIPVKRFLEVDKKDFSKYGLSDSKNVVTVYMKNGDTRTLVIGNDVGVDNEVYALYKEKGVVCTLESKLAYELIKDPSEYRSLIICTLSNVFLRELSVTKGSKKIMTVTEGEKAGSFVMDYPYSQSNVSSKKIDEFLMYFGELEAEAIVEENPSNTAKYGFSSGLNVYIYDSAGKHNIKFGNLSEDGGVYVMYGDRPVVYRGTFDIYEKLKDINPIEYLEPYVHYYPIDEVLEIKVEKDATSNVANINISDSKKSYTVNSKHVNTDKFEDFYYELATVTYGNTLENSLDTKKYCTITFKFKNGTTKTFNYYDLNDDYCSVKTSNGFKCMVLKSIIDRVCTSFATLTE